MNLLNIVGNSTAFRALMNTIRAVAPTSANVLIQGEIGTGKTLAGKLIQHLSPRASHRLLSVDCAAIPAAWLEAELFGRLHEAHGGTLLIKNPAEMPQEVQVRLPRIIQQQEFQPPGSAYTVKADVRLVVVTTRNLGELVKQQRFRSDLYNRLLINPIHVPPLRERRQDIPILVQHFLSLHARQLGRAEPIVSDRMLRRMLAYDWPGNVRELENLMFRATLSAREVLDLPVEPEGEDAPSLEPITLEESERRHVQRVLGSCRWTIEGPRGAAAVLNIPPSTLRSLMKRLGVERPRGYLRTKTV